MYRYQTKHKVLSLLLVFSLLILTPVLVFPSPVSANLSGVWPCPDVPIFIDLGIIGVPQYCSDPIVPPLTEVSVLRLSVTRPMAIAFLVVELAPSDAVYLTYMIDHWESSHPIIVVPGPPDLIEVTFDPPLAVVDRVCLGNTQVPFPGDSVVVDPLELVYSPQNQPPVADAGGPYNGFVGVPVTLDGSASYDPDGNITLYEWDFEGDGTYDYSSTDNPITTHAYSAPLIYDAKLRVTDDGGLTDTDIAAVTIIEQPLGSISGMKFEDVNGNGAQEPGEGEIAGWAIQLKDGNGNLIASTTTNSSGEYCFDLLPATTYQVHEALPLGWTQTVPGGTGYHEIPLSGGQNIQDVDFGNQYIAEPPVTEVGGDVYPVDRLAILIPGLTLAAILIAGAAVVMRRRRARC